MRVRGPGWSFVLVREADRKGKALIRPFRGTFSRGKKAIRLRHHTHRGPTLTSARVRSGGTSQE